MLNITVKDSSTNPRNLQYWQYQLNASPFRELVQLEAEHNRILRGIEQHGLILSSDLLYFGIPRLLAIHDHINGHQLSNRYDQVRKLMGMISTHGTFVSTGVILHGSWLGYHTDTGRTSVVDAPLQSLPKWVREYAIASPGKILVSVDMSNAELRLAAYFSQDYALQHDLDNIDVHRANAKRLAVLSVFRGWSLASIRPVAKMLVFAISYGVSNATLVKELRERGIVANLADVSQMRALMLGNYPMYEQYLESLKRQTTVHTLFGDFTPEKVLRTPQRLAFPQQHAVAVILKLLESELATAGFEITFELHDEIFIELLPENLNQFQMRLEQFRLQLKHWLAGLPANGLHHLRVLGQSTEFLEENYCDP